MIEYDLYAQRIDAFGNVLWTSGDVVVSAVDTDRTKPRICSDRAGRAFVDDLHGNATDVGPVHIDAGGTVWWAYCISRCPGNQRDTQIVSDGEGECQVV
jgi:hypothetical protein